MQEPSSDMLRYLAAWGVSPDGPGNRTPSSELLPGIRHGVPVMLKIARVEEEVRGAALMHWWNGRGAAPVLERDGGATLMVRARGGRDLAAMAASGRDAAATEILVDTALALHERPAAAALDDVPLIPLRTWFRDLLGASRADPLVRRAAEVAERLLAGTSPADVVVLHGDIHHGNVLDFGSHWAAIDPKGLIGHRAFDVANIFCNPSTACALENLPTRLDAVSRRAGITRPVLAEWTLAWCGLSLTWGEQEPAVPKWAGTARAIGERLLGTAG